MEEAFLKPSQEVWEDVVESDLNALATEDDLRAAGSLVSGQPKAKWKSRKVVKGAKSKSEGKKAPETKMSVFAQELPDPIEEFESAQDSVYVTGMDEDGERAAPLKGGIWPSPFPGYKGLFTYEVKEASRETDKMLGNGVYLWELDILAGTVHIGEPTNRLASSVPFGCQMRKKLVSLPDDACSAMKDILEQFVTEQWSGTARIDHKVFRLDGIGPEPIESTINFTGIPLPREALAGEYEMELAPDDSVVKAIHVSWMNFAKIHPDDASGFMFRITEACPVCPVLRPAIMDELERKLQEAAKLLHGSTVYQRGEVHTVRYWPTIFRVADIATMSGTFTADLEVAMDYLVSRDDVFEYIIRPAGWEPRWRPRAFETLNAYDLESVVTNVRPPTLKVLEQTGADVDNRELRAEIIISFRGTFEERFELQSFPFDVQPLHVKLAMEQEDGVEVEALHTRDEELKKRMQKKWSNTEWVFLDLKSRSAHKAKLFGSKGTVARLFVSCRVRRHARPYLVRIIGVIMLICCVSVCIFVQDANSDLPDMVGQAFTMLLTLTTFSLVVGDVLPNLGYLTVLDRIILISFAFLATVIFQITYIGRKVASEDQDDRDSVDDFSRWFAIGDLVMAALLCIFMTMYVNRVVIARELRKKHASPQDELDDAMGETSKTSTFGRVTQTYVNSALSTKM